MGIDLENRPKRRWYQFSLRTLLVVMTVAILSFGGWVQYRRQRAQVNRDRLAAFEQEIKKAVAAIEELGGQVKSKHEERRARTWLERQFGDPGSPQDPADVLEVTFVDLAQTEITNADLKHLKGLTNLRHLGLYETKVSDAGLAHIEGLTKLESLILQDTNVSDTGLEHLKGLTNLQVLFLDHTRVTDAGVKKLQQALPNCKIWH